MGLNPVFGTLHANWSVLDDSRPQLCSTVTGKWEEGKDEVRREEIESNPKASSVP